MIARAVLSTVYIFHVRRFSGLFGPSCPSTHLGDAFNQAPRSSRTLGENATTRIDFCVFGVSTFPR